MNGVKRFRGECPCCGEPVSGLADPYAGATVPQPGRGEVPLCLMCLLFPDAAGAALAHELIYPAVRAGFENADSGIGQ